MIITIFNKGFYLVSERTHFDKASAILDSNSQEMKRGPRDGRGEAKKMSNGGKSTRVIPITPEHTESACTAG